MKLVALWLTALGLALATGCSVNHRSGDFACGPDQRCSDGRTCVDGFCVLAADSGVDARPHPPDAAVCPSPCTSCSVTQKTCTIDCALNGGCKQAIACPAGFSCNVLCTTDGACSSGVSCASSTSCTVTCSGRQSCQSVSCGLGPCNITCSGFGSCSGAVLCGSSCACDVTCRLNTCQNLTCKQGCTSTSGCSSAPPGCNTCK